MVSDLAWWSFTYWEVLALLDLLGGQVNISMKRVALKLTVKSPREAQLDFSDEASAMTEVFA